MGAAEIGVIYVFGQEIIKVGEPSGFQLAYGIAIFLGTTTAFFFKDIRDCVDKERSSSPSSNSTTTIHRKNL